MKAKYTTLFQNTSKNGFLKAEPFKIFISNKSKAQMVRYTLYSDGIRICDFDAELDSKIDLEKEMVEYRKISDSIHDAEKQYYFANSL